MNFIFLIFWSLNFACTWTSSHFPWEVIFPSWLRSIYLILRLSFGFNWVFDSWTFDVTSLTILPSNCNIVFSFVFLFYFFIINFGWWNFFWWMQKMFILFGMRKRPKRFSWWPCRFLWSSLTIISTTLPRP